MVRAAAMLWEYIVQYKCDKITSSAMRLKTQKNDLRQAYSVN